MTKRKWIFIALLLMLLVSGCAQAFEVRVLSPTWTPPAVNGPSATPDVNATVVAAVQATNTALAQTSQATASPTPTSRTTQATVTRTATPRPPTATPTRRLPTSTPTQRPPTATPTPWPQPLRIQFAPGATSATATGHVEENGSVLYILRALGGQTMQISVMPAGGVNFSVWGADGTVLKSYGAEAAEWDMTLPSSQDYFIHLISILETDYVLTVTIPPLSPEPSIEVLSPNGGEQWLEGNAYNIMWVASDVAVVDIAAASGGKDLGIIASLDAGLGTYTWLIPPGLVSNFGVVRSDQMRLRISDGSDPSLYDENDNPFSVLVPRIQFAPGGTSTTVTGHVTRNSSYRYVLRAFGGQMMEVAITSPNHDVLLNITGLDGVVLKNMADGQSDWQGELPSTQDYFLEAVATGMDSSFQVTVAIAPQETEPVRIQFAPGAASATMSGHVAAGNIDRYVFRALAEQTAEVVIAAPGPDVVLDLIGEDGTMLRHHTEGRRQWAGRLPTTQDYIISVVSVGQATGYDLLVRIEPLESTPTRIQFEPGTTWATVSGNLVAGGSKIYVLRALGGQTMDVGVMSPGNNVGLSVWGADGQFLKWHGDGVPGWRGQLPATQDYYLEVITVDASSYALTVEIPPL